MFSYFVIMKYNITDETNLRETIKSFQGALDLSIWNMISASLIYNLIPIAVSLILYFPIVYGIRKLIAKKNVRLFLTGFVLTLTTPIFYIMMNQWRHNNYYQLKAEWIAWTLCFIFSIGFYIVVNSWRKRKIQH